MPRPLSLVNKAERISTPELAKKPPKNREFLGLAEYGDQVYWDIFFWGTKVESVSPSGFVDRELFDMPPIRCWTELPEIENV